MHSRRPGRPRGEDEVPCNVWSVYFNNHYHCYHDHHDHHDHHGNDHYHYHYSRLSQLRTHLFKKSAPRELKLRIWEKRVLNKNIGLSAAFSFLRK